ncbi:MAG TPA: DUF308 domain-containing protein [Glaciihabitans sp.]|jgi:uncharacterized membrane protein HdeD (DUF308 family)|nr:DUF308 domain-containing protein [Glaciihabitans sp.]
MTLPTDGSPQLLPGLPVGVAAIHRGELIGVAIIGLILGGIALFLPEATLLSIAIIFGSYLIVSGIFRITSAFVTPNLSAGLRWMTGLLGLVIIVAGILCLANPTGTLIVLAYVIGIGWIAEGIVDFTVGFRRTGSGRWLAIVSGVISIVAGLVVFALPGLAASLFVVVVGIMLIVVSVTTLLTLPPRDKKKPRSSSAQMA